jgi:DNA invertase Pin-like site-specific DNA recombinase
MKVLAYYRVSSGKQAQSGLGLMAQRTAVEAFVESQGWELVSSHTDAGISGKTPAQKRPGLKSALGELATGKAEAIVIAKIDRLSRDTLLQLTIEKTLNQIGAKLISVAGEGTEDNSPSSTLIRHILAVVAANEAAMVSVRTKAAMDAARSKGIHLGRAPYGFSVLEGHLIPNMLFPNVEAVLDLRETPNQKGKQNSYNTIAQIMNEIPNQADTNWTTNRVFNIIKRWKSKEALLEQYPQ